MTKAQSKDGFKPCPNCYSNVEIVMVERHERVEYKNYFFVNCTTCGEGTPNAFSSMDKLQNEWNQKVDSTVESRV